MYKSMISANTWCPDQPLFTHLLPGDGIRTNLQQVEQGMGTDAFRAAGDRAADTRQHCVPLVRFEHVRGLVCELILVDLIKSNHYTTAETVSASYGLRRCACLAAELGATRFAPRFFSRARCPFRCITHYSRRLIYQLEKVGGGM